MRHGSVAVLVFPRDEEKGERIVQALANGYQPTLLFWESERLSEVLDRHDHVVAVMAVGIIVRSLCGCLKDKWTDKPVVAVDSSLCCAVPVVGGHHGANELARCLAGGLGLFPAITTATDSSGRPCLEDVAASVGSRIANKDSSKAVNLAFLKGDVPVLRLKGPKIVLVDEDVAVLKRGGIVVGVGARKGVSCREVLEAVDAALAAAGRKREEIGLFATAWLKRDEVGMIQAAKALGKEMLCLSEEVLNAQVPSTASRASDLGLAGVAEPAVLALATKLVLPKRAYGRVTVAIGE
jgi:cobalt-precorrin 5A hydrolase